MNNRMKKRQKEEKRQEKQKRQMVSEIFNLVLQVNGLSDRKRSVTGNLPTVFAQFYGHVSSLCIDICSKGWSDEYESENRDISFKIRLDSAKAYREIKECKEFLIKMRDGVKRNV